MNYFVMFTYNIALLCFPCLNKWWKDGLAIVYCLCVSPVTQTHLCNNTPTIIVSPRFNDFDCPCSIINRFFDQPTLLPLPPPSIFRTVTVQRTLIPGTSAVCIPFSARVSLAGIMCGSGPCLGNSYALPHALCALGVVHKRKYI